MMPFTKRFAIVKIDQCETGQAQSLMKKVSTAFGGVAVRVCMKNLRELVNREKLFASGVVANNLMNRGRGVSVTNGYQKELSFDLLEFLRRRLRSHESVAWLDICCGEGRAVIEAAIIFAGIEIPQISKNLEITGIDLAGMFQEYPSELNHLRLLETPVENFTPSAEFDLITCVHGLHYIGDKLAVIQKAAGWLKEDGMFLANLELRNLKLAGKPRSNREFSGFLRKQGFNFDVRKHLLSLPGKRNFTLPFDYLGADDQAGPNSTGQPAVDSYYRLSI